MGFSGSTDRMALLPAGPDPRWLPAAILENFKRPNCQDRVAKKLILHPVLISGIVNGRPFKFFTEVSREKYNIILYIQKFGNSIAVAFCVVFTSVTISRDM